MDVLTMNGVQVPEQSLRLVETSQSVSRGKATKSLMFCVTSRSRPWITTRCRLAHGKELMRLQGVYYHGNDDLLDAMSSDLLADMAGNAFHAGCCAAALLTLMVALARGCAGGAASGNRNAQQGGDALGPEAANELLDGLDFFTPATSVTS